MKNTSLGYHTFSFFQNLKADEYDSVSTDFAMYARKNKDMKGFPVKDKKGKTIGWEYSYKSGKGIRWKLTSRQAENGFIIQGVTAVVNPQSLIKQEYISAAKEADLELTEKLFNEEAAKISPLLEKLGFCSLSRADPCLNIDLGELNFPCSPEQMMMLIKQGNIPRHYKEREIGYDKKQHRKITDKNSFYLESKSSVINYYWKYPQQDEKHPNYSFRELSRNVIRMEVQCRYSKLYALSKDGREKSRFYVSYGDIPLEEVYERLINDVRNPSTPMDIVLKDENVEGVTRKHFYRVLRKGDYFTINDARSIIESYHFMPEKENRLVDALEQVSDCRGITKAKSKLHGPDLDEFKRSLNDLDKILVNPVTIPRRWSIRHIPNLLHAYYDSVYEEQLISGQEYLARQHIDKILSK